jgi:excisionase family DNA binding protein
MMQKGDVNEERNSEGNLDEDRGESEWMSVDEALAILPIGETLFRSLLKKKVFRSHRFGRRVLINRKEFREDMFTPKSGEE